MYEKSPVALQDVQHDAQHIAHHLFEGDRPLYCQIDAIETFKELQVIQALLPGLLELRAGAQRTDAQG